MEGYFDHYVDMDGFIGSLIPFFRKYLGEIMLILLSFMIALISLTIYLYNQPSDNEDSWELDKTELSSPMPSMCYIDIAGSIINPGVYEVTAGARLKDLISMAGGPSEDADSAFFYRNFNLARLVTDQEKIYLPSIAETTAGLFVENARTLNYYLPVAVSSAANSSVIQSSESEEKININSATEAELDLLPGIGLVTAKKIIDNRPFYSLEDLLIKKAVSKSVFEKIKDLIIL